MVVGAGFVRMLGYQFTNGHAGETPAHWPRGTTLPLDQERKTLIMFAHPRCPCTRASLEELNRLMARRSQSVAVHVKFLRPPRVVDGWTKTDLRQGVAAIPGINVSEDLDGSEAARFGAETSGFVVLYDPQGRLLFKGGITGSRGHVGDNEGQGAVSALLAGESSVPRRTRVFGCSLLDKCDGSPAYPTPSFQQ